MINEKKILEISQYIHSFIDEVDKLSMQYFNSDIPLDVITKTDGSFVTLADQKIEDYITSKIIQFDPNHAILGEERGQKNNDNDNDYIWIIDPIDATNNYLKGIPIWATLISCIYRNEVISTIVSAPAMDFRLFANINQGSYKQIISLNTVKRINVSKNMDLNDSYMLYGSYSLASQVYGSNFEKLLLSTKRQRGFGDFYGHSLVAEGASDFMVDTQLHIWDIAPFLLILKEAGGAIEFTGDFSIDSIGNAISANSLITLDKVKSIITKI